MTNTCAICKEPLTVEVELEDSDNEGMNSTELVPDDVALACGDHLHWQCLLDSSYEIAKCPSCEGDISAPSQDGTHPRILVMLNNEGGRQEDIDLFPILQEECYLKTYPEERKCRAFLEFCREGDHRAAVGVLTADDDDDDIDEPARKPQPSVDAILRYQDPLAEDQSALHAAAANGHREIAWLLLLLASDFPELDMPALVYQEAATLGVMREDQAGKTDIRSLRDAQGRTADDIAKESGDIVWNGWIGSGRLSMP